MRVHGCVAGTITRFVSQAQTHVPVKSPFTSSSSGDTIRTYQGLQVLLGGHCGMGPPSALTWIGLERAPASSRAPTNRSTSLFTVELLFGMDWEVQPW